MFRRLSEAHTCSGEHMENERHIPESLAVRQTTNSWRKYKQKSFTMRHPAGSCTLWLYLLGIHNIFGIYLCDTVMNPV